MSTITQSIEARHPIHRDEVDRLKFFGRGWSCFPEPFQGIRDGVTYYLSVCNTPIRVQVSWYCRDVGLFLWQSCAESEGRYWIGYLTPEESLAEAAVLGLNIEPWLARALEACRTGVGDALARW